MKKTIFLLLCIVAFAVAATECSTLKTAETAQMSVQPKELKVLSIGNSFSANAHRYLKQIVESHGKHKLVLGHAMIGGCSFKTHWTIHMKEEAEPEYRRYHTPDGDRKLTELLTQEKWDIVTIQSVSHESFLPELWQPYADNLVELIHKLAPQAKIYIHRTWAYRPDHRFFKPDFRKDIKDFTPQKMYDLSGAANKALSEKLNAPLIPAGEAMWIAYQEQPVKHIVPDPNFDFENPVHPQLPKDDGALIRGWSWRKDKKGELYLGLDGIHANLRGEYLIGCTWYAFLFNENINDLTYAPEGITPEDAAFLRSVAQKVADEALKQQVGKDFFTF